MGKAGSRHRPPAVHRANHVVGGHLNAIEEDLVEVSGSGDLTQGPHIHTLATHVEGERRDALMLGGVGIGPGQQISPVGVLAVGGPHLLPVDDELVAIEARAGAQAGQVAAGAGLAEQLAPDVLARADARQEEVFLRSRAALDDRRSSQLTAADRHRGTCTDQLFVDDGLVHRVRIGQTPVLDRPEHTHQLCFV